MRIIFLSTWYPFPADNGSKIRIYHLLQALGQRHEVSLIAFSFGTAQPGVASALDTACRSVETVEIDPFVANRATALRRYLARDPVVTRAVPAMGALAQQRLAQTDFDAVIASGAVMAAYVPEGRAIQFKSLEEHNCFSKLMHERYLSALEPLDRLRNWFSWQKARRYERRLFDSFDLVTLVSEQDKAYSSRYVGGFSSRVEVVPNGVDCEWHRPGLVAPAEARLVYSGALSYSANFDAVRFFLSDIFPRIREEFPEIEFRVTGSTEAVALEDLQLDGNTVLTGYVDDIRAEVAGATACVIPLRQGGGTRLKILEALALGTPVVSTSKGAEGLAVEPGKHLLIADEPGDFARQTVKLLSDAGLRRRLAENGRRLVETRYDWRSIGQAYAGLVAQAVLAKRGL